MQLHTKSLPAQWQHVTGAIFAVAPFGQQGAAANQGDPWIRISRSIRVDVRVHVYGTINAIDLNNKRAHFLGV